MLVKENENGDYSLRMKTINCDFLGYSFLAELQFHILNTPIRTLSVHFYPNNFIEANLFAVLGAVLPHPSKVSLEFHRNITNWTKTNSSIRKLLERNGFLNYYNDPGEKYEHSFKDTTAQYKIFKKQELIDFSQYIKNDVLKPEGFPKMSEAARKKIIEGILEVFLNSIIHGQTDKVFICGQYYPNKGFLKFTLVDLGITIKTDVYRNTQLDLSGTEAIKWAVSGDNTTRRGNIPGGLGLKMLRNFLKLNGGSIQIISNDGYWQEKESVEIVRDLKFPFSGTIVTISFNTTDSKQYIVSGE